MEGFQMNLKIMGFGGVAGLLGAMAFSVVGCSSEPAKVKVAFRVVTEKGAPMEEVQVTFLSKDNKNAEMSQSVGGGLGSVMLFPNTYGIGVSKYEGGRSAQSLRPGSKEFEEAKATGLGNIPPSNILPAQMEDPTKSGLEVTVKPGMDKTVDIVVKGVAEFKNPSLGWTSPRAERALVGVKARAGTRKPYPPNRMVRTDLPKPLKPTNSQIPCRKARMIKPPTPKPRSNRGGVCGFSCCWGLPAWWWWRAGIFCGPSLFPRC
jgi:hypothetical protein